MCGFLIYLFVFMPMCLLIGGIAAETLFNVPAVHGAIVVGVIFILIATLTLKKDIEKAKSGQ